MARISISRPFFLPSYRTGSHSLSPQAWTFRGHLKLGTPQTELLATLNRVIAAEDFLCEGSFILSAVLPKCLEMVFPPSIPQTLGIYVFMKQIRILSERKERLSVTIPEQCADWGYPEQGTFHSYIYI